MNAFYEHHKNSIGLRYRCFDRLLLNGLIQPFQQPERVIGFFNTYRAGKRVTRNELGDIAEQYTNWVINRSSKWGVPVMEAPDGRRDDFVDQYFKRAKPDEVVAILRAREPGRILIAKGNKKDDKWHLQMAQRWVIQSNFYVNDARWGRMFVRVCPYFPFTARVCLNQHHWLANRMREEKIDFQQCSNAFLKCGSPKRLQEMADLLTAKDLLTCGQKWLAYFTPYFSESERKEHGCQPRLFFAPVEYCDNLVFHRRAALEALGERLLDANRTIGQPNKITTIFGRKVTKLYSGELKTVIEDLNLPNPVIRSHYGSGFIKQYVRDHLNLRAEPATNNVADYGVKKAVENLPQLRDKMAAITDNYLDVQQDILETFVDRGQLRKLAEPTVLANGKRVPGLKIDHPRQLALMHALVRFANLVPGGRFMTKSLHPYTAEALGLSMEDYRLASLRYDLSKLRAKGLVEKVPRSRNYRLTRQGYSICLVFLKLFERIYAPLTAGLLRQLKLPGNPYKVATLNSRRRDTLRKIFLPGKRRVAMKKRYQIDNQRAVQKFRRLATEVNPTIQMMLPLAGVVGLLQEGVGHLMREAGLLLMMGVMDEEVRHVVGERYAPNAERQASRWGKEQGYCVVDGQKVPIARTRVRDKANREVRLGSYELFQRSGPLQAAVWDKMMRGLSTRNYGPVVKDFANAYGVEKSAVSEKFIEASREKLKELMERALGNLQLCAILIDGTPFRDRQMIVALGIGCDGRKTVLGLREGATENTTVVSALLSDLLERGLDFSVPRLYILDGGKALPAAVRRHAGEAAFIQRCQVHKKRNVIGHLPEEHKAEVKRKMQNAFAMVDYGEAKRALDRLHRELMDINPSAARSLEEGLEETLTVHKLRVPEQLRRTLSSTNVIESAFSIVETVCRNVKRWRDGDQIERWVGSGLVVAERQFRKVIGHRQIPLLLSSMANAVAKRPVAKEGSYCVVYELQRVATFNGDSGNFSQFLAINISNNRRHNLIGSISVSQKTSTN